MKSTKMQNVQIAKYLILTKYNTTFLLEQSVHLKSKNESLLRSEDCVGNGFAIDETQLRSEKTCLDNRLLQI